MPHTTTLPLVVTNVCNQINELEKELTELQTQITLSGLNLLYEMRTKFEKVALVSSKLQHLHSLKQFLARVQDKSYLTVFEELCKERDRLVRNVLNRPLHLNRGMLGLQEAQEHEASRWYARYLTDLTTATNEHFQNGDDHVLQFSYW